MFEAEFARAELSEKSREILVRIGKPVIDDLLAARPPKWRGELNNGRKIAWNDKESASAAFSSILDEFKKQTVDAAAIREALIYLEKLDDREFRKTINLEPRGLYLRNAFIDGPLDLQRVEVPIALSFENCIFAGGVHLRDAETSTVHFRNCLVPYVNAQRLATKGVFALLNCFVPYGVNVDGARIHGDLMVAGSVLCAPPLFDDRPDRERYGAPDWLQHFVAGRALQAAFNRNSDEELTAVRHEAGLDGLDVWPHPALAFASDRAKSSALRSAWRFDGLREAFLETMAPALLPFPVGRDSSDYSPNSRFPEIRDWLRFTERMKDRSFSAANVCVSQDLDGSSTIRVVELGGEAATKGPRAPLCSFGRITISGAEVLGSVEFKNARLLNIWTDEGLYNEGSGLRRVIALKGDGLRVRGNLRLSDGFEALGTVRFTTAIIGASVSLSDGRFHAFHIKDAPLERPAADGPKNKVPLLQKLGIAQWRQAGDGRARRGRDPAIDAHFFSDEEMREYPLAKAAEAIRLTASKIDSTIFLNVKNDEKSASPHKMGVVEGYLVLQDTKVGRILDRSGFLPKKGFLIIDGFDYGGFTESSTCVSRERLRKTLDESLRRLTSTDGVIGWLLFVLSLVTLVPLVYLLTTFIGRALQQVVQAVDRRGGAHSASSLALDRIEWLELQPAWRLSRRAITAPDAGFVAAPYEKLAEVLEKVGLMAEARRVHVSKNLRELDDIQEFDTRLWMRMLGFFASFGYNPWKSARMLASTALAAALMFSIADQNGVMVIRDDELRASISANPTALRGKIVVENGGPSLQAAIVQNFDGAVAAEKLGDVTTPNGSSDSPHGYLYPPFHVLAYGFDVAVPFLDLGQYSYWGPYGSISAESPNSVCPGPNLCSAFGWKLPPEVAAFAPKRMFIYFEWVYTAFGFLFATLFAAGMAGVMKQ